MEIKITCPYCNHSFYVENPTLEAVCSSCCAHINMEPLKTALIDIAIITDTQTNAGNVSSEDFVAIKKGIHAMNRLLDKVKED